ncbi:MAG: system killer suppression protein [Rhodobacteraceae bacterium]|nr:system killer suppression protein [Paracoccaceae bacterium]
MQITFKTTKLGKLCASAKKLQKSYGEKNSKLIKVRLEVLKSALNLAEIPTEPPFRLHRLQGKRKGEYAVDIGVRLRLVFKPDYDPVPRKNDGGIDKEKITKINVIDIVDYH